MRTYWSSFLFDGTTPRTGPVAALLGHHRQGRISRAELLATVINLFVAGHVTTAATLTDGVRHLLLHRDLWQALCAEPALVGGALEEILRYGLRLAAPAHTLPLLNGALIGGVTRLPVTCPPGAPAGLAVRAWWCRGRSGRGQPLRRATTRSSPRIWPPLPSTKGRCSSESARTRRTAPSFSPATAQGGGREGRTGRAQPARPAARRRHHGRPLGVRPRNTWIRTAGYAAATGQLGIAGRLFVAGGRWPVAGDSIRGRSQRCPAVLKRSTAPSGPA
ncbi:cytochrome P450 [Streptomyces subrutilus]|uniref:cytochrome P450 n=1 Tax=Streptomyces subrutilus TaxID=36818 RepID=UPI0033F637A1